MQPVPAKDEILPTVKRAIQKHYKGHREKEMKSDQLQELYKKMIYLLDSN
jgi:hypothetical protein